MTAINLEKTNQDNFKFLNKIMNDDEFDEEVRKELINSNSNEEFIQTLMKHDSTSSYDDFMAKYIVWANNQTKNLIRLTYISRFRNFLGTLVYGTPESQKMPFYFYYTAQDKVRSAPFHFSTTNKSFDKYRLFVNRYTRFFRQRMTKLVSISLIVFGLVMGVIVKPAIIETKAQYNLIKDVSTIRSNGENNLAEINARVEEDKKENLDKAKSLKAQYENGEITPEEFNAKATEIKNLDTKYNDLIKRNTISRQAQIEIDIALRKKKDNEFIQSIRDKRDEELKQFETKGE